MRALPVLVLGYAMLMMHFVFSRAFRDSLLVSHVAVSGLPSLTILSTLLSISASLLLSFFLGATTRIQVIRLVYVVNAAIVDL